MGAALVRKGGLGSSPYANRLPEWTPRALGTAIIAMPRAGVFVLPGVANQAAGWQRNRHINERSRDELVFNR